VAAIKEKKGPKKKGPDTFSLNVSGPFFSFFFRPLFLLTALALGLVLALK
jgi:hypothetical protein